METKPIGKKQKNLMEEMEVYGNGNMNFVDLTRWVSWGGNSLYFATESYLVSSNSMNYVFQFYIDTDPLPNPLSGKCKCF